MGARNWKRLVPGVTVEPSTLGRPFFIGIAAAAILINDDTPTGNTRENGRDEFRE